MIANAEDKLNGRVVENLCDSEMDECSDEVNPNCSASLPFDQDGLMNESLSIFEDLKPSATPQTAPRWIHWLVANLESTTWVTVTILRERSSEPTHLVVVGKATLETIHVLRAAGR
jgi:hypothetical protein